MPKPADTRVFLGVDPGTNVTGFGVISVCCNTIRWVDSGVVSAPRYADLPAKLAMIFDVLSEKMVRYGPCTVCVEQAFYAKNVHTTLILGHARGVVLLAAHQAGASLMEFSPREIKKAVVGNGNASKDQIGFMVKTLLSPPAGKGQTDACDALAAALCGYYSSGLASPAARALAAASKQRSSRSRRW